MFQFNGNIYEQIDGDLMVGPTATLMAVIV